MKDPNFEGSLAQELGMDAELCETCGANLYNGICLNGCGLRALRALLWRLIKVAYQDGEGKGA